MMRNYLKGILAPLLLLCSYNIWAYDFKVDDICYNIVSGDELTCEVTYTGSSRTSTTTYSGDIVIPETIQYNDNTYTVVGIGQYSFYYGSDNVTSVTFSKTITSIGNYAFYNCTGLKDISWVTCVKVWN